MSSVAELAPLDGSVAEFTSLDASIAELGSLDVASLYRRYAKLVYRRVLRFYPKQEAEEVVHEVFVKAIENLDSFRHASSASTWLYQLTTNHCINRIRDEGRRRELWREQGGAVWGPSEIDAGHEARVLLRELWAELDHEAVMVGVLYFVDGLSHAEIARIMNVSRRTVGNRVEALRVRFEEASGERILAKEHI